MESEPITDEEMLISIDDPTTMELVTSDQIFENLMTKFETFFKLDQNHPNEEIIITICGYNAVLKTQTGFEYKAAKLTLADDEWELLNERTSRLEKAGKRLVMPRTKIQRDNEEFLDEDELLGDDVNDVNDRTSESERVNMNDRTRGNEWDNTRRDETAHASSEILEINPILPGLEFSAPEVSGKTNDVLLVIKQFCEATNKVMGKHSEIMANAITSINNVEVAQRNMLNDLKIQQQKINSQTKKFDDFMRQYKQVQAKL